MLADLVGGAAVPPAVYPGLDGVSYLALGVALLAVLRTVPARLRKRAAETR